MTIGMATELVRLGVRVNGVRPGMVDTPIHAKTGQPNRVRDFQHTMPLGRAGRPEEVAESIVWLLSDKAIIRHRRNSQRDGRRAVEHNSGAAILQVIWRRDGRETATASTASIQASARQAVPHAAEIAVATEEIGLQPCPRSGVVLVAAAAMEDADSHLQILREESPQAAFRRPNRSCRGRAGRSGWCEAKQSDAGSRPAGRPSGE